MEAGNILALAFGAVGILSGIIMLLHSKNKQKDQIISGLKAVANLADSISKANEQERIANEQEKDANEAEKDYNGLRNKLLSGLSNDDNDSK